MDTDCRGGIKMVHLVYCDNAGKKGEKVLDKILAGTKTMVVRGAAGRKIPHSRVFEGERLYFMEKGSGEVTATALVKEVKNFVKLSDEEITKIIQDNFDLRPAAIIETFDLRRPIYKQTAAYGHFGRTDIDLPWEKTDRIDVFQNALK